MEVKTNGLGTAGEADAAVSSPFFSTVRDRAKTETEDPYPYSVKVYPDGSADFTLYNVKEPSNSVIWPGKIDKVPVGSTSVVE